MVGGCGGSASAVAGPLVFSAGVVSGTSGLSSVRLGLVEAYPKLVQHDEAAQPQWGRYVNRFADIALARRIEGLGAWSQRAFVAGYAERFPELGAAAIDVAGGVAAFLEHGSPVNGAMGLGRERRGPRRGDRRARALLPRPRRAPGDGGGAARRSVAHEAPRSRRLGSRARSRTCSCATSTPPRSSRPRRPVSRSVSRAQRRRARAVGDPGRQRLLGAGGPVARPSCGWARPPSPCPACASSSATSTGSRPAPESCTCVTASGG